LNNIPLENTHQQQQQQQQGHQTSHYVYIQSDQYGWIPARLESVDMNKYEAIVNVPLYRAPRGAGNVNTGSGGSGSRFHSGYSPSSNSLLRSSPPSNVGSSSSLSPASSSASASSPSAATNIVGAIDVDVHESYLCCDGGKTAFQWERRTIPIQSYPNYTLPLQNVDEETGMLQVVPDMVDLPFLHEVSYRYIYVFGGGEVILVRNICLY
jgi:hypothetical protein